MSSTNPLRLSNLQTIEFIKKGLKEVGTRKVLKRVGFTQQNLSKHLRKEDAENANLDVLNKIIAAIAAEKRAIQDRARKTAEKASQLINQ